MVRWQLSKWNEHATQIVLPILYLDFLFYLGKFGVLFTDYENISTKLYNHILKKETWSLTKANAFELCDRTQP